MCKAAAARRSAWWSWFRAEALQVSRHITQPQRVIVGGGSSHCRWESVRRECMRESIFVSGARRAAEEEHWAQ